jgi:O-methyltransferase
MSQCVMKYINWEVELERSFYLYDTFLGFDQAMSDESDFGGGIEWMSDAQEKYANPDNLKKVKERMSPYTNVEIVKGSVPDSLQNSPSKIAFMHIDLNSPKAESAALEILFDRMSPGGFIVLDDYGWFNMQKQKDAALNFFTDRKIGILELPTGQGLVLVPPRS